MPGPLKGQSVKVAGLSDLRRELKKLDDGKLMDELKDANYEVAQMVVDRAQAKAAGDTSKRRKQRQKAMASLRPSRQAARAQVVGGGADVPFFGGSEFGAMQNQKRNTYRGTIIGWNQFDAWKGNGSDAGYALYPAIREATDDIVATYGDAMERIAGKAFPD